MASNLAPSKKGQQTKDCIVIESYLYLAKLLREQHFTGRIVFLTSNKHDYSNPTNPGTVHPDLSAEFAAVGMAYAISFQMAEHLLK